MKFNRRRNHGRRATQGRRFSIGRLEPLEERLLLSAVGGQVLRFSDISPESLADNSPIITADDSPIIDWSHQSDAAYWQIWGNQIGIESRQFFADALTESEYSPEQPLTNGHYRMFVRAVSAEGQPGRWSRALDFTVDPQYVRDVNVQLTWSEGVRTVQGPPTEQISSDEIAGIDIRQQTVNIVQSLPADFMASTVTSSGQQGTYEEVTRLAPVRTFSEPKKPFGFELAESDSKEEQEDRSEHSDEPVRPSNGQDPAEAPKQDEEQKPDVRRIAEEPTEDKTVSYPIRLPIFDAGSSGESIDRAFHFFVLGDLLAAV